MEPLDRSIVEDLYRRYGFQVERRCRRLLRNPEDALDASQEVFVRALSHGGSFRGAAEWMTWLYRVATNVCLNRLRDHRTRQALLSTHAHAAIEWAAPGPDGDARIDYRVLLEMLTELDDTTREIVVYHVIDEMPQREISSLVGLSRVTVNKRIMRFRAQCEERMQRALARSNR